MKEDVRKKARQAALSDFQKFVCTEKEKYQETLNQYEELLKEYYRTELRLDFLREMDRQGSRSEKNETVENLKREQIITLKKINDIENSSIPDEYDAFSKAVRELENRNSEI